LIGLARERAILGVSLAFLAALAWAYTAAMALHGMESHLPWSATQALLMLLMWFVMMVAMMIPSAAPMIMIFARVGGARGGSSAAFVSGYLALWLAFSVLAVAVQATLQSAALLSPAMASASAYLSGSALIAAGIYQFTPWKNACLAKCRTPLAFLMTEWRSGASGAFVMGLRHGLYCVGCCWLVMLLLFLGGVMNLAWIAVLTFVVLAEKVLPHGERIARILGGIAIACGAALLYMVTFLR